MFMFAFIVSSSIFVKVRFLVIVKKVSSYIVNHRLGGLFNPIKAGGLDLCIDWGVRPTSPPL